MRYWCGVLNTPFRRLAPHWSPKAGLTGPALPRLRSGLSFGAVHLGTNLQSVCSIKGGCIPRELISSEGAQAMNKVLSQSAFVSKALSQSASVREWLRGLIPVPSASKGEPKKSADDKESQKA